MSQFQQPTLYHPLPAEPLRPPYYWYDHVILVGGCLLAAFCFWIGGLGQLVQGR